MTKATHLIAVAALLLTAQQAMGEDPKKDLAHGTFEVRFGGLWEGANSPTDIDRTGFGSIGFRFAAYTGQGAVTRRLNVQISYDAVIISDTEVFNPSLDQNVFVIKRAHVLNPAVGFDVVQTSHVDLTAHIGVAALGNHTKVLDPLSPIDDDEGGLESLCSLQEFQATCGTEWNYLGNAGGNLRIYPKKGSNIFFGVAYTRYAAGINQLVGTFGGRF